MMGPPTVVMRTVLSRSAGAPNYSPAGSRRCRRNALADVTVGITAEQLHTLEETVQTFVPDFFNPGRATAREEEHGGLLLGHRRRNAVADVTEGLSHDDLHHLEDLVRTYQPDASLAPSRRSFHWDDDSHSSGDGEDSCSSPMIIAGPDPAYYERRRNALANPLADLDCETLQRIHDLHNCRRTSLHRRDRF